LRTLLDDLLADAGGNEVAAMALLRGDGAVAAATGAPITAFSTDDRRRTLTRPANLALLTRETREGRDILVGVFPCRCLVPGPVARGTPEAASRGWLLVGIALYADELSAPFARLRRDAAISASAALALLVSLTLIAAWFGPYMRRRQLEVELGLARRVQRDILPSPSEVPRGIDVAAVCLPASQVGGDFYDIETLSGGRVAFVLGDVSGHGLSAALLMGLIDGAVSFPLWGSPGNEPDQAATRLNRLLLAKSSGERFASLFWCSYDAVTQELQYLNAGHLPALWLETAPDGTTTPVRLSGGGPVLGVLEAATYRVSSVTAHEHDLLVLFSDGVVEAANQRDERFGEDRLVMIVQQHQTLPARAICDAVLDAVRGFTGAQPAQDDQTLLVVRLWRDGHRRDPFGLTGGGLKTRITPIDALASR
jgi:sigma-B regulation protein RsbU (phosphoserine phosphatase)